jgi:hypothetical protein
MSGMHMLPVYYTTTNTRRRKKKKKTKALLAAEKEHEKFLHRIGVYNSKQKPRSVAQSGSAPALGAGGHRFKSYHSDQSFHPCVKKDESYKLDISGQYVVGQAYNKGGLQVLSKKEQNDPATGKRR